MADYTIDPLEKAEPLTTTVGNPLPLTPVTSALSGTTPAIPIEEQSVSNPALSGTDSTTAPQVNPTVTPNETGTALAGATKVTQVGDTAAKKIASSEQVEGGEYQSKTQDQINQSAQVKSGESFITPNSTVAGQLDKLLNSDSAYIKNAKRLAQQQATALGLGGSSMAVGASVRAAIENGLPIAQQDAEVYAKAVLQEQDTYNAISKNIADGIVTADLKGYQNTLDQAMATKNAELQTLMTSAEQAGNTVSQGYLKQLSSDLDFFAQSTMANLDAKLKVALQNQQISSQERLQTQSLAAQIVAGTQAECLKMLQDADFLAGFLPPASDWTGKDADGNPTPSKEQNDAAWKKASAFLNNQVMGSAKAASQFVVNGMGLLGEYNWQTLLGTY